MLTFVLFANAAQLQEIRVPIPIAPLEPSTLTQELIMGRFVKKALHRKTYATIQSTTPQIRCIAAGKDVRVDISFDPTNWPTLPKYADCEFKRTTLRIYPIPDAQETSWVASNKVVDLRKGVTIPLNPQESGFATYKLPDDIDWVAGEVNAIDAQGELWKNVSCEVLEGENDRFYMRLRLNEAGVERKTGSCPLPSKDGVPTQLRISILDALSSS